MGILLMGTSGFSYPDWRGGFYPSNLPSSRMLEYYAGHFPACELNFSYYRQPTAAQTASMVKRTGGKVVFVVKAHQSMTHGRDAVPAVYREFLQALEPLQLQGVLGAVLLQFPYAFENNPENQAYLAEVNHQISGNGAPLVVEFRHRSWHQPELFAWLRKQKLGLVNVDEPDIKGLMPVSAEVTSSIGYVRFHGRNRNNWFKKAAEPWERYDYLYSENELWEWIPNIRKIASQAAVTFVFFNNHWQSKAVSNAKQLAGLLNIKLEVDSV